MRFSFLAVILLVLISATLFGSRRYERFHSEGPREARVARATGRVTSGQTIRAIRPVATAAVAVEAKPVPEAVLPLDVPAVPVTEVVDSNGPAWTIVGDYRTSPEEAKNAALDLAQQTVTDHLRKANPTLDWLPPTAYVADFMVKKKRVLDQEFGGSVGKMYRYILDEVRLSPEVRADILRHDREIHAQARMAWLAKVLAIVVALLAGVAGYFRLDHLTKGNCTRSLRLASIGFVVGAIIFVLLLA